MKVIIAGGRDFDSGIIGFNEIQSFIKQYGAIDEVVCGMAKGADMVGLSYANIHKIPVKKFKADWKTFGKSAGPIRNDLMARYADALIAFWDGESRGTKDMIRQAEREGLKIRIVYY